MKSRISGRPAMQRIALGALVLGLCGVMIPSQALACGGCFSPPGPNLVVQDAERVLFLRDAKTKTSRVWVEVRYSGPAENFGWVLPVPKVPKVGVGNSYVFDRLDQAVAPRFFTKFANGSENCNFGDADSSGVGCGAMGSDMASGGRAESAGNFSTGNADGGKNAVVVLEKAKAGPYNFEVVQSKSSDALFKWLNDNKYDTPKSALPVIESHVAKGDVFVAVKLDNEAGVNDIRPITLEMQDAEPCVPLRLTAIAASNNMAVVVYLLGQGRAVPKNHMHVEVNETKLRWAGGVNNYTQVLAQAIDEAAGRAFVTEFAGPSKDVAVTLPEFGFRIDSTALFSNAIPNPQANGFGPTREPPVGGFDASPWKAGALFPEAFLNGDAFKGAKTQFDVAFALQQSQFIVTDETAALFEQHTALAALMGKTKLVEFWTQVRAGQVGLKKETANKAVDGGKLYDDLKVGIIEPIYIVNDALKASGNTLTRLHLRIDPAEMDRDPIFAFNADLPAVSNVHSAEMKVVCTKGDFTEDAMRLTLKSGSWIIPGARIDFQANQASQVSTSTTVALNEDSRFKSAPFASRVELLDETGDPVPVPKAQIDLVDTAIKGAVVGTPSLSKDLALTGELAVWTPPKSDPDAGLLTSAENAHPDDSGCSQALHSHSRATGLALVLLLCGLVVGLRRRRA